MTRRSQTCENLERRLRRARGGGIGRCGRREEGRERLDVSLEAGGRASRAGSEEAEAWSTLDGAKQGTGFTPPSCPASLL